MEEGDDETPCPSCGGRGWKLISSVRLLTLRALDLDQGSEPRREDCRWCAGSGIAESR